MHGTGTIRIFAALLVALVAVAGGASVRAQSAASDWGTADVQAEADLPLPSAPATKTPASSSSKAQSSPSPAPAPKGWAPLDLGKSSASPDAGSNNGAQPPAPKDSAPAPVAGACQKTDFEAVVDDAAGALRDLNMQNKPLFQERLRQLKDKRGWSHDEFLAAAAPFVRDEKIAVYDRDSERLLTDISTMGQEGAEAATPDCALLADLKSRMQQLVDTQSAKWGYMFQKLDAALKQ
ncbi:hypothetical protein [Hyphomicrobium sulfonivorans]|uniref:hypothetical protein n=1 Tax=Hyphomicrobium sulfonivorans TaxID=121290 RepID=UPI00157102DE|nr:hypothetical protein [Hyphomicrobium sulfonivorans]MBI1651002.1 hypothetical protein [Hyphomicrobium sulfonivorans]